MTDQIREQLSALLDGELPRDEMSLLLRRLERDPALRRSFGAYALIGESLRSPGARVATPAFASRVSAAIDVASPVTGTSAASRAAATGGAAAATAGTAFWKRPLVRTALAASAAAVAVVYFRPAAEPIAQLDAASGGLVSTSSPTLAQSQRLARYMVAHSQYSTPMVRRNVLSSLLAADPGIARVSFEMGEAP